VITKNNNHRIFKKQLNNPTFLYLGFIDLLEGFLNLLLGGESELNPRSDLTELAEVLLQGTHQTFGFLQKPSTGSTVGDYGRRFFSKNLYSG
jgi:hypothetical protein